jgi:transcription elongation factor GreB
MAHNPGRRARRDENWRKKSQNSGPMGRFRIAEKPASRFITPEGHARLRAELDDLWRIERPRVTQAVAEAAAQGDRSENAEYTYGKRRLREIDRRVRHLRRRLEGMVIVDRPPSDRSRIYFGAWVDLEDEGGAALRVRIVGPDEFDLQPGYISLDAPLARALLGRARDDEIRLETPAGPRAYTIAAISYDAARG